MWLDKFHSLPALLQFPLVFGLGILSRLPLKVGDCILATTGKRFNVVDHVARAG